MVDLFARSRLELFVGCIALRSGLLCFGRSMVPLVLFFVVSSARHLSPFFRWFNLLRVFVRLNEPHNELRKFQKCGENSEPFPFAFHYRPLVTRSFSSELFLQPSSSEPLF